MYQVKAGYKLFFAFLLVLFVAVYVIPTNVSAEEGIFTEKQALEELEPDIEIPHDIVLEEDDNFESDTVESETETSEITEENPAESIGFAENGKFMMPMGGSLFSAGSDVSLDFKRDYLKITYNGTTVYEQIGNGTGRVNAAVDSGETLEIGIKMDWSQVDITQNNFSAGDSIKIPLVTIEGGDPDKLKAFSNQSLKFDGKVIGTASIVTEMDLNGNLALYYQVIFDDGVEGLCDISGEVDIKISITGTEGNPLKVVISGTDEAVIKFDPKDNEGDPSDMEYTDEVTDNKTFKEAGSYNASENTMAWDIYARAYTYKVLQDYKDGNKITGQYGTIIIEDTLDIHQKFNRFQIMVPMYLYDSKYEETMETADEAYLYFIKWASLHVNVGETRTLSESGTFLYIDPQLELNAEQAVRNTPLSYTVVELPDSNNPGRVVEKLIINLGEPLKNGLKYTDIKFGDVEQDQKQAMMDLLQSRRDVCQGIIDANSAADEEDEITYGSYKYTKEKWRNILRILDESLVYYAEPESEYLFTYRINVTTDVLVSQEETALADVIKNEFCVTYDSGEIPGNAEYKNEWSSTLNARAANGEVQLLKVNSLYGYDNSQINDLIDSPAGGLISGVKFQVFRESDISGDNPLKFTFNSSTGKYDYNAGPGGENDVVTNLWGSVVISGLTPGAYYFKEIDAPEGYYTGQNQKIPFVIQNMAAEYTLAQNEPRYIALEKADADEGYLLKDAVFKLYQYNMPDYSDAQEISGFTKTKIQGNDYWIYDGMGKDLLVTGENGKIIVSGLTEGKYYFEEVQAPENYQITNEKYAFELYGEKLNAVIDITAENKKAERENPKGDKDIEIVKRWVGGNANNRPDEIIVDIYRADSQGNIVSSPIRTAALSKANNWRIVIKDLPEKDAFGNEILYVIRERDLPAGYTVSYNGFIITNTYENESGGSGGNEDDNEGGGGYVTNKGKEPKETEVENQSVYPNSGSKTTAEDSENEAHQEIIKETIPVVVISDYDEVIPEIPGKVNPKTGDRRDTALILLMGLSVIMAAAFIKREEIRVQS